MGNRSNEQYVLLTDYDTNTAYSEAYSTLFANIRLNWDSSSTKQHTLLLTTPTAHTEQAAAVANVAIAAAQSRLPTLLVDADLRAPSLQQRFGLAKGPGLSDLLAEESISPQKIPDYLQSTFVPGLQVLGAGTSPSQGALLLLSPKLEEAVSSICQYQAASETQAGVVIFHSAPVLAGADASLIAALVEQTFLSIIVGYTTRAQAKQAQEQLERAHAKLAGVIMLNA
jgi:Mrp family chromosome partitioning ATPase